MEYIYYWLSACCVSIIITELLARFVLERKESITVMILRESKGIWKVLRLMFSFGWVFIFIYLAIKKSK